MTADLEELKILERELERLTGCDISTSFIGGVFGGTYRRAVFRDMGLFLNLCFTEAIVTVLVFIFSLPVGLLVIRNSPQSINQLSGMGQVLQPMLVITLLIMVAWNLFLWLKYRRLQALNYLLDEVDRYNEMLTAIQVLERLGAVNNEAGLSDRDQVLEALNLTRNSLICGLITEKILRDNRGMLARRTDLLATIETNLATLRTLEICDRATEYGQLLNTALQIGVSVHREVQTLTARP